MKIATKTTIIEIVATLLIALVIFLGVHFTLESRLVNGISMWPNLEDGQRVLVCKAAYWFGEPGRGDVVVFHNLLSDKYVIHRIVALPNEKAEIRDGRVYVNDSVLEESYIQGDYLNRASEIIPAGCYLIVGDNRDAASADIVPRNEIVGRAFLCYWPLGDWHLVHSYTYH